MTLLVRGFFLNNLRRPKSLSNKGEVLARPTFFKNLEIPRERISVAEVARLREFSGVAEVAEASVSPNVAEFAKIWEFGYRNSTNFSCGEFVIVTLTS